MPEMHWQICHRELSDHLGHGKSEPMLDEAVGVDTAHKELRTALE